MSIKILSRINFTAFLYCLRRNDTIGQKLRDSVVLTEQMRSVSKENVVEVIDSLTPSKTQEAERNVKAQLGIA